MSVDVPVDLTVIGTGAALWLSTELLKGELAPSACRWCDRLPDGTDNLNSVDSSVRTALRWSQPKSADTLSSGAAFVLAPVFAFGLTALVAEREGARDLILSDALVVLEASVLAADVNQLVKFSFGRERPFVHALPPEDKAGTPNPTDNNVSFYSGHTTLAFALAVSSGTVASMRGYRMAPVIWSAGLVVATTTAYLRIAGDMHYLTDVVAAAAIGSAIGFAVPYVFHSPRRSPALPVVAPLTVERGGGVLVVGTF